MLSKYFCEEPHPDNRGDGTEAPEDDTENEPEYPEDNLDTEKNAMNDLKPLYSGKSRPLKTN